MKKILIIGAGAWGTALANCLAKKNSFVHLWTRNLNQCLEINNKSTNQKYYKNLTLSKKIKAISGDILTKDFEYIFYVLPANQFNNFSHKYLKNQLIKNLIICSKGLSEEGHFLSQVATKTLKVNKISILSGPSFAQEVIQGMPTALSLASNSKSSLLIGSLFKETNIRIYYSKDYKTLEILGIIKNIYAIGAGIIDAMKLGENARASFITRCASEMQFMLNKKKNLNDKKVLSLAGIGDLILTCSSSKSRNYSYGKNFILSKSSQKLIKKSKKTIEGLNSILSMKKTLGLNLDQLPILSSITSIIKGRSVEKEIKKLFSRKFKDE